MENRELDTVFIPVSWGHYNAVMWLHENGLDSDKEEDVRLYYYYQFKQKAAGKHESFFVRKLDNGVKLVYGYSERK